MTNQFLEQLRHLRLHRIERRDTLGGGALVPTHGPATALLPHAEEPALFEPMQHGIQGARPDPVAVLAQLIDHALTEDLALRGVIHDVQRDQPRTQGIVTHRQMRLV